MGNNSDFLPEQGSFNSVGLEKIILSHHHIFLKTGFIEPKILKSIGFFYYQEWGHRDLKTLTRLSFLIIIEGRDNTISLPPI